MVLENSPFAAVGNSLFANAISGTFIILGLLIFAAVIIGVAFYVRWIRQFNIFVEILSSRSAGVSGLATHKLIYDKAAIIYEKKDKCWYFRILKMKVDLPVPPFDVLQNSTRGNVLKLWQKSNEEFIFMLPDILDQQFIRTYDGKVIPLATLKIKQVEGDVAYWNQLRKRQHRKLFDTESLLMKILPYLIPVLMFMLVIFLTWIVLSKFEILRDVANSLQETAKIIRGTTTASVTTG